MACLYCGNEDDRCLTAEEASGCPGSEARLKGRTGEELQALKAEVERWHRIAMDAGVIVHEGGTTSHPMRHELAEARRENEAMREALERIKARKDGYKGEDLGRVAGYRVCGEIAEEALKASRTRSKGAT